VAKTEKRERLITKSMLEKALQDCSGVNEAVARVGCKLKRFYNLVHYFNLEIPSEWIERYSKSEDLETYRPAKAVMDIKGTLLKSIGYDLEGELYASSF
jgi:hypothetical protein